MDYPILLVEDTPTLSMVYETVLRNSGFKVECVASFAQAFSHYKANKNQIVLLDLQLPDGDGMDLISKFQRLNPDVKIIVITVNGSINRAVEAMRCGAFDFLVKPFDEKRMLSAVENAYNALDDEKAITAQTRLNSNYGFQGFVGSSPEMHHIYDMVRNIGRSTATVFVTGESGTGKELCAQAIHAVSSRAKGPFIPINCAAIPRDLLESEVFGHLKGSFTGAITDKKGAAAAANGGTLFLDEICEMDLSLQTKLLRFLQTSTIQPVGATQPKNVDVRIVCATNRDPIEEVKAGRFREDLFYRLHVVPIHLPPLRDRPDDVLQIAKVMLRKFSLEEGKSFTGFSSEVDEIFKNSDWPGNVRQLMNVIRNTVVLNNGQIVVPDMLPSELTMTRSGGDQSNIVSGNGNYLRYNQLSGSLAPFIGTSLASMERDFIEATIDHCDGSIPKAAKMLDVSPSTIYRKKESWEKT